MNGLRRIPVKLPDSTTVFADVSGISYLLIKDLKFLLYQQGVAVPPHRMKLIHGFRALGDVESVLDMTVTLEDPIHVVARVTCEEPLLLSYEDFIVATHPKHSAINVPVTTSITVTFKANPMGHIVYTPSLVHFQELQTLLPVVPNSSSGSDPFAEVSISERFLLLHVEESLELRLDELCYDMARCKPPTGDPSSWRRYSTSPPVPCEIRVPSIYDPLPHEVVLTPSKPLRTNAFYAAVLLHNVPSVPTQHPRDDWHYFAAAIGADKIIVFRTERPQLERPLRSTASLSGRYSKVGSSSRSIMS